MDVIGTVVAVWSLRGYPMLLPCLRGDEFIPVVPGASVSEEGSATISMSAVARGAIAGFAKHVNSCRRGRCSNVGGAEEPCCMEGGDRLHARGDSAASFLPLACRRSLGAS